MHDYRTKQEAIAVTGAADLQIRSLVDGQQYDDTDGAAAALGISSASWALFGQLWPSGRHLAAAMAVRRLTAGERQLEVGCGLALASLVSHRRGVAVTASDNHPLTRAFLRENVRLNGLPPLPYCHADWRSAGEHPQYGDRLAGRFDLIMGSDVLYEPDEAGVLPQFIGRHATRAGEVWIVDPDRGNRSAFRRRMEALGYELEVTLIKDPLGPGGPYSGRLLRYRRAGREAAV